MKEYIERDLVLKKSISPVDTWITDDIVLVEDILSIPSANVEEIKYGKWISRIGSYTTPKCSYCNWSIPYSEDSVLDARNYCPNCGAKMDWTVLEGEEVDE